MKLAEYGELYSFIEHTDRFDENFKRAQALVEEIQGIYDQR